MYITFENCKNYILGDLPKPMNGVRSKSLRKLLIKRDFHIDTVDTCGNTLVMIAADQDNLYALQQLLAFKPNLEIQNELGYTALAIACSHRFVNIIKTLLLHGADPESVNYAGDSALDITYNSSTPMDELQKAALAVESYSMTEQTTANRLLTVPIGAAEFAGGTERRTPSSTKNVHADCSAAQPHKLTVKMPLCKRSNVHNEEVSSIYSKMLLRRDIKKRVYSFLD